MLVAGQASRSRLSAQEGNVVGRGARAFYDLSELIRDKIWFASCPEKRRQFGHVLGANGAACACLLLWCAMRHNPKAWQDNPLREGIHPISYLRGWTQGLRRNKEMKRSTIASAVFALALSMGSVLAFAQGRGGGRAPGGPPGSPGGTHGPSGPSSHPGSEPTTTRRQ